MRHIRMLLVVAALVICGSAFPATAQEPPERSDNWLLDAGDDTERFKRVERMFGGFSTAMQIVGERYARIYDAVAEGNFGLADYHWKKLREAIELGYLRRPAREANAVALFLENPGLSVQDALDSKKKEKARAAFASARLACMACHLAENVPFMNDQPLFRRSFTFPDR
jgi:hypothetical protein